MESCKVTAIANQKGGAGKTVTSVSLGVGLARAVRKVLLVDADPQASLTVSVGIRMPDELDTTISTVMQSVIEERPPPTICGSAGNSWTGLTYLVFSTRKSPMNSFCSTFCI